jgi:flagellar M-ring protein FliF
LDNNMAATADDLLDTPAAPQPFLKTTMGRNVLIGGGVAAVLAVLCRNLDVEQAPDYRVLYANYSDKDGGAITASLDQMGVKYKFSEGGTAILVPAEQVPTCA